MPTYVYCCDKCGHRFELFHRMNDEDVHKCPICGGATRRVPTAGAGLIFKGGGFYKTDYSAKKSEQETRKSSASCSSCSSKNCSTCSS